MMDRDAEAVSIDGERTGSLEALDRGLHFGDGVFETIACRAGRPRFLDLHLERLVNGCERLRIPLDAGMPASLREEIRRLAGEAESSIIKLIVTRGIATARGYRPSGLERPTRIVLRYTWPPESAAAEEGVTVCISPLSIGENPALAGLKHLNRLEQVLARLDMPDPDAFEALLFSSSGRLVSGTMSNVFIAREGHVLTPRIDLCGVAGVMRRVVLREAQRAGVPIEECVLERQDLESATEVFLTNARIGIRPVRRLESRQLQPGPVTRQLQRLIAPLLEEPVDA